MHTWFLYDDPETSSEPGLSAQVLGPDHGASFRTTQPFGSDLPFLGPRWITT